MKKSIIAAGASAVLAAMPIVGVFATDHINGSPIVDTLTMNLQEVCTLSRKVTSDDNGHPAGASAPTGAAWTESTASSGNFDTFTASIVAGNTYNDIAESAFNVTCNDVHGGYKVTVAATNFDNTNWQYNAGGYGTAASAWYLDSSNANKNLASGIVWQKAADNTTAFTTDDFTITYNVKVGVAQAAKSYTATATYTLADIGA